MSNPNLYASQSFSSPSNLNPTGINPAMLAAGFQNGPGGHQQQPHQQSKYTPMPFGGGAVNPAQLMGAGGGLNMNMNLNAMNSNPMGAVNPAQLLQQSQQQTMMNGMAGMNMNMGMMGMNPGTMNMGGMSAAGINPAALSQPGNAGFNNPMTQMHHPQASQSMQQLSGQQQQMPQVSPQIQIMLTALGMTREQFFSMSQQEQRQAWMKLFNQMQSPSNANHTPGGGSQHQMMPPPAPPIQQGGPISVPGRPPTSQSSSSQSGLQRPPTAPGQRPSTAQGQLPQQHRPTTAQGMQPPRPPTAQGMQQRPPTSQGHRNVSGSGGPPQPQTPMMSMAQMQRPPTAQDQRQQQGQGGQQQNRPPNSQGMPPQTPTTAHVGLPGSRPQQQPQSQQPNQSQAQNSGQQISRPGTALSHRSPVSTGAGGSGGSAQSPGGRPPSRLGEQVYGMNGYPPKSQGQGVAPQQISHSQNPYPQTPQQQQSPFAQAQAQAQKNQQGQGGQGQFGFQQQHSPITPQHSGQLQQQTPQQGSFNLQQGQSPAFGGTFQQNANAGSNTNNSNSNAGSPPPHSSSMSIPGSPLSHGSRGTKRRIDSPGVNSNAMGPPSMMPNRMSMSGVSGGPGPGGGSNHEMNGMTGMGVNGTTSQSPRPPSRSSVSGDMMNMNPNMSFPSSMGMTGVGMGMGPQTPQRPGGGGGGGGNAGLGMGMSGMGTMGGMPGVQGLTPLQQQQLLHHQQQQQQQHQQQHQHQHQHQHQQLLLQQQQHQQQHARQVSLPPGVVASPVQVGGMRTSLPPSGAVPGTGPNVTGPITRASSVVSGTPGPPTSVGIVSGGNPLQASNSASSITPNPNPNVASNGNAIVSSNHNVPNPNVNVNAIPNPNSTTMPNSTTSSSTTTLMNGQLPPLPSNVNLNPSITVITPVPLKDSIQLIPQIPSSEIENIQKWMKRDKEYENVLVGMKERMRDEVRKDMFGGAGFGNVNWWEKGAKDVDVNKWKRVGHGRDGGFDVRYPIKRGREMEGRDRRKRRREGLRLPRKLDQEEADRPEQLVPIRLEFDVDHHKMRDTFVWNLNDPVVTPESFAQSIVDDYALGPSYHSIIVKSIQEQLNDFRSHSVNYDVDTGELISVGDDELVEREKGFVGFTGGVGAGVGGKVLLQGSLDEEQMKWWELWRKRSSASGGSSTGRRWKKKRKVVKMIQCVDGDDGDGDGDGEGEDDEDAHAEGDDGDVEMYVHTNGVVEEFGKPLEIAELKVDEELLHEELRILIKLDIIVGSMKLEDQFEWDLENDMVTPEEFAEVYAQDLGLGGEFKTAIAHIIREQVQAYQKSLFLVGLDGTPVQDEELRSAFLPSLAVGARPMDQVPAYTPLLNAVSDSDIERNEKERDKEYNKRRKRNQRTRRGMIVPGETIRTYRTPAVGFPELDPATLALATAANVVGSRRAAAAAASLTIANMVASENGTAFIPTPTPIASAPIPQPLKDKKPKGLFKAPNVPNSVLKGRANVVAPTTSTAADVNSLPTPLENDPPPVILPPPPPPEPKMLKMLPKFKTAKELEKEAKEKEFVDGQHPNFIDGVWHCSNCGCPESIAIGRRKGPLGEKSQCGTCGKFWHRHRRPRPVEYNPDPEYHMKKEDSRTPARKKAAALRAQSATAATSTPIDLSEPPTPVKNGDMNDEAEIELSSRRSPSPLLKDDDDRAISPVSTASSASEAPLMQKAKLNGSGHHGNKSGTPRITNKALKKEKEEKEKKEKSGTPRVKSENGHQHQKDRESSPSHVNNVQGAGSGTSGGPSTTSEAIPSPNTVLQQQQQVPAWLTRALQELRVRYPEDTFEAIVRRGSNPESQWRLRCLDCPGKLYTPGPGESLSNYEVHLRNRLHRQRVHDRRGNSNVNSPPPSQTTQNRHS